MSTTQRVEVIGWEDDTHGSVFDLRLVVEDDLTRQQTTIARGLTPSALATLIHDASGALAGHMIDNA